MATVAGRATDLRAIARRPRSVRGAAGRSRRGVSTGTQRDSRPYRSIGLCSCVANAEGEAEAVGEVGAVARRKMPGLLVRRDADDGEQRFAAQPRRAGPRPPPCCGRWRWRPSRRRRRPPQGRWRARCGCAARRSRRTRRCRARRSPGWRAGAAAMVASEPRPISMSPSPVSTSTRRRGWASARPRPTIAVPPIAPQR